MLAVAMKLGLLTGLLAVLAAVLAEGTAPFDHTLAARVRAFERVGHGSPRGQLYASTIRMTSGWNSGAAASLSRGVGAPVLAHLPELISISAQHASGDK